LKFGTSKTEVFGSPGTKSLNTKNNYKWWHTRPIYVFRLQHILPILQWFRT
jgi:hypothetical protein